MRHNYTAMIPQTEVRRQAPPTWSLYHVLSTDTKRALTDAGVSIVGSDVLARTCPQCGQRGQVGVTERDYTDGIRFIVANDWTCRRCREATTAHWVASPKPTPASRGGSAPVGSVGKNPRRRATTTARAKSKRQQLAEARREFDAAVADGDLSRASAAYHRVIHLGGRVQWPAAFGQEVQA